MKEFDGMIQARPFIKWVGGKTQLLDEVNKSLPRDFAPVSTLRMWNHL